MKKGNTPFIKDVNGNKVQINLHHLRQKGKGPLVEVKRTTHNKPSNQKTLHPYGNNKNPTDPVNRKQFDNVDRPNYWKNRVKELENMENK